MRINKRLFFSILIFSILFLVLLSTGFYLLLKRGKDVGDIGKDSGFSSENISSAVKILQVTPVDDGKDVGDRLDLDFIIIQSKGKVYEKEITVQDKEVRLFVLKSQYDNDAGEETAIDVVVAVLYDGSYENILNWWTYNLVTDEIQIDELGNDFFNLSYLESVYKEGRFWKYAYYSNDSIPVSDDYSRVVKEVMQDLNFEDQKRKISSGQVDSLILMPYLIFNYVK